MDLGTVTSWREPRDRGGLALAPGERLVAGGSWLFSEPQPDVTGLVDLRSLGWTPWHVRPDGSLSVAATCTVRELLDVPATVGPAHALLRPAAESFLMSFKVWNVATVGGNVCLGLPAGAMISLLAGLDADAVVWTPDGGERVEPVATLVRGPLTTTLTRGEVLRSLEVPAHALAAHVVLRKIALTALGRSSALVVGRVDPDGSATFTVTASTVAPVVLRFPTLPGADALDAAWAGIASWYDDPHGPADWRRGVTRVLLHETREELL